MSLKWPTGHRLTETRRSEAAASIRMTRQARWQQKNFQSGRSTQFPFKGTLPPKTGKTKVQVKWYRTYDHARFAEKQSWAAHDKREGKRARSRLARAGAGA